MDLRRLSYFITVAEEGNVGRAARRLNMSQPPLSQRIPELEKELGCALFVRTPQGMCLTPPGEALLAQTHEGVAVSLVQGDLADPTVGVLAGRVDAVITFTPFTETGLAIRTVSKDRCFVAVPSADPLATAQVLLRKDLRGRESVRLPDRTDPLFRAYWQPTPSHDGPLVRSLDECLHAVLWRHAIAFVPEQIVRRHPVPGITYVPVGDMSPTGLVLAWRRADRSPLVTDYVNAFCTSARKQSTATP